MAEEKRTRSRRSAGLAAKVVKDPERAVGATVLSGFLGDSPVEDNTRLYLSADFDQYVDVPDESLLHVEEPSADAPLTPALVWVSRDAKLAYGSLSFTAAAGRAGADPGQINQFGGAPMGVTIPPFCGGAPTMPPLCQHTVPPFCPPLTTPPGCPVTVPPICPPPTLPPHCPPPTSLYTCHHTVTPICIPPTSLVFCHHSVLPIHCPPTGHPICYPSVINICPTAQIICHPTITPPCHPTLSPPCLPPTHTPPCGISVIGCPSLAGCPSGPACGGPGGLPGAGGGPAPF